MEDFDHSKLHKAGTPGRLAGGMNVHVSPSQPEPNFNTVRHVFNQHFQATCNSIGEYVPEDMLDYLVKALSILKASNATNVFYLLAKTIALSSDSSQGFGTHSLPFHILQMMLVSFFHSKECEDQASLLACSDMVVPFLFDKEDFLDKMNSLLFPKANFAFSSCGNKERLFLVRMEDRTISCQYEHSNVDCTAENSDQECTPQQLFTVESLEHDSRVESDDTVTSEHTEEFIMVEDSEVLLESKGKWVDTLDIRPLNMNSTSCQEFTSQANVEECVECHLKFGTEEEMMEHKVKKLCRLCVECDKIFSSRNEWLQHQIHTHKKSEFICHVCNKDFVKHVTLNNHLMKIHGIRVGKHYSIPSNVHTMNMKVDGDKSDEGSVQESYNENDVEHSKVKVEPSDDQFEPNSTPVKKAKSQVTSNKFTYNLHEHMAVHDQTLRFKCEECGELFKYRTELKRHGVVHSDIDLTCSSCEKVFTRYESLKKHTEIYHPQMLHTLPRYSPPKTSILRLRCGENNEQNQQVTSETGETDAVDIVNVKEEPTENQVNDENESIIPVKNDSQDTLENSEFSCDVCGKEFQSGYNVRRHMKMMHDIEETDACRKNKKKRKSGNHKIKVTHSSKRSIYCCSKCCVDAWNEDNLQKHIYNDNCVTCVLCEIRFESREELLDHKSNIHTLPEYICEYCQENLHNAKDLLEHFKENCTCCFVCNERFKNLGETREHTKTHTNRLICKICQSGFASEKKLDHHMRTVHNKAFECTICNREFPYKDMLQKHKKEHEKDEKSFTCDVCDMTFMQMYSLNQHMKLHNEYLCNFCGQNFQGHPKLQRHLKLEHPGEIHATLFNCDHCGKVFTEKRALTLHVNMVHLGLRKYTCELCGKGFKQSHHLKDHQATHDRKNRYQCEVCGAGFLFRPTYKRHMQQKHLGIKAFVCPVCGNKFSTMEYLKCHVRRSHKGVKVDLPELDNVGCSLLKEFRSPGTQNKGGRRPNSKTVVIPEAEEGKKAVIEMEGETVEIQQEGIENGKEVLTGTVQVEEVKEDTFQLLIDQADTSKVMYLQIGDKMVQIVNQSG